MDGTDEEALVLPKNLDTAEGLGARVSMAAVEHTLRQIV